jgi:hypothetical protein
MWQMNRRLILVFAKKRDLAAFVASLVKDAHRTFLVLEGEEDPHIVWCKVVHLSENKKETTFGMYCERIDSETFETTFLSFVIENMKEAYSYALVGTCGSTKGLEKKSVHYVTSAVKYDSGVLRSDMTFDPVDYAIETLIDVVPGETIWSGAFFCEADDPSWHNAKLIDKETFNFFTIVTCADQVCLGAVKVVTNHPGTPAVDPTYRYAVPFDSVAEKVEWMIESSYSLRTVRFTVPMDDALVRRTESMTFEYQDETITKLLKPLRRKFHELEISEDFYFGGTVKDAIRTSLERNGLFSKESSSLSE